MSRWLKSVNNLLETLDGQAENVADEGGGLIDDTFGQLLQNSRQAVAGGIQRIQDEVKQQVNNPSDMNSEDDDDYYDDEYDEDYDGENGGDDDDYTEEEYFSDLDGEVEEEEVVDDEEEVEFVEEEVLDATRHDDPYGGSSDDEGTGMLEAALLSTGEDDDAISIEAKRQKDGSFDNDTVSEISFAEYEDDMMATSMAAEEDGDVRVKEVVATSTRTGTGNENTTKKDLEVVAEGDRETASANSIQDIAIDTPPKTPNRYDSGSMQSGVETGNNSLQQHQQQQQQKQQQQMLSTQEQPQPQTQTRPPLPPPPPPPPYQQQAEEEQLTRTPPPAQQKQAIDSQQQLFTPQQQQGQQQEEQQQQQKQPPIKTTVEDPPRTAENLYGSSPTIAIPPSSAPASIKTGRISNVSPRTGSPTIDQSPIPPRRSVDGIQNSIPPASAGFLDSVGGGSGGEDAGNDTTDGADTTAAAAVTGGGGGGNGALATVNTINTVDNNNSHIAPIRQNDSFRQTWSSAPPKIPTRQSSFPKKSDHTLIPRDRQQQVPQEQQQQQSQQGQGRSRQIKDKESKEYQKLLAKVQSLQAEVNKSSTALKVSQGETQKLQKKVKTLEMKLESANVEINAQSDELQRAGEQMEMERRTLKEEREDILDEHDEEMEQLRISHEEEINELKERYEKQMSDLTNQLNEQEQLRVREGGDYSKEMKEAVSRERSTLEKLDALKNEKVELQTTVSNLNGQVNTLQSKLDAAMLAVQTAESQVNDVETKCDTIMAQHAHQLNQRQMREAELEKTIAELGTSLTTTRQQQQQQQQQMEQQQQQRLLQQQQQQQQQQSNNYVSSNNGTNVEDSYKDKYLLVEEELETLKVQLDLERQQRLALQSELQEISTERSNEIASAQERQRKYDEQVSGLTTTISKLQSSLREYEQPTTTTTRTSMGTNGDTLSTVTTSNEAAAAAKTTTMVELEASRNEIRRLSEQLLKQRNIAESSKTEILALKGRLQAATVRADDAEKRLGESSSSAAAAARGGLDVEIGNGVFSSPSAIPSTMRRRVKGRNRGGIGGGYGTSSASRSIRAALNLAPGRLGQGGSSSSGGSSNRGSIEQQVAVTIDALDIWMVETFTFMRHEPLARLAFLLYLIILHLWSFALVVFHTTEPTHADFGNLGSNPRNWRPRP